MSLSGKHGVRGDEAGGECCLNGEWRCLHDNDSIIPHNLIYALCQVYNFAKYFCNFSPSNHQNTRLPQTNLHPVVLTLVHLDVLSKWGWGKTIICEVIWHLIKHGSRGFLRPCNLYCTFCGFSFAYHWLMPGCKGGKCSVLWHIHQQSKLIFCLQYRDLCTENEKLSFIPSLTSAWLVPGGFWRESVRTESWTVGGEVCRGESSLPVLVHSHLMLQTLLWWYTEVPDNAGCMHWGTKIRDEIDFRAF